jgi:hypothetical protein
MVEVEFDSEKEGVCFNESMSAEKIVKVKAGNRANENEG